MVVSSFFFYYIFITGFLLFREFFMNVPVFSYWKKSPNLIVRNFALFKGSFSLRKEFSGLEIHWPVGTQYKYFHIFSLFKYFLWSSLWYIYFTFFEYIFSYIWFTYISVHIIVILFYISSPISNKIHSYIITHANVFLYISVNSKHTESMFLNKCTKNV